MVRRKSPVRHTVKSHTRRGKTISSYERGRGKRYQKRSRVVGKDRTPKMLKYVDPISESLEKVGTWELKQADMNPEHPYVSYYRHEEGATITLRRDDEGVGYLVFFGDSIEHFDDFSEAMVFVDRVQRTLPIHYWDRLEHGEDMGTLPLRSDYEIQKFYLDKQIDESFAVDRETKKMMNLPMPQLIHAVEMHDYLRHYFPLKELATEWQETPHFRQRIRDHIEGEYREKMKDIVERKTLITIAHNSPAGRHESYSRLKTFLKKRYPDKHRIKTVWHEAVWDHIDQIKLPKSFTSIIKEAVEEGYLKPEEVSMFGTARYGGSPRAVVAR